MMILELNILITLQLLRMKGQNGRKEVDIGEVNIMSRDSKI